MADPTKKMTLEAWSEAFYEIYSVNDDERSLSNFWVQVSNDASKVAESVRKQDLRDAIYNLGNAFCWTCCFAERLRLDMERVNVTKPLLKERRSSFQGWILYRYPQRCFHCGQNRCHCGLNPETMEYRKDEAFESGYDELTADRMTELAKARKVLDKNWNKKIKKWPLTELFKTFLEIYSSSVVSMRIEDITFHYLEEIGEVGLDISAIETLLGELNVNEWSEKAKSDPKLDMKPKTEKYWEKVITDEDWQKAFEQARKNLNSAGKEKETKALKEIKGEKKPYGSTSYAIACSMVMDELSDVFSWTATLTHKILLLLRKYNEDFGEYSLVDVFTGQEKLVGEKNARKKYWDSLMGIFKCPYCGAEHCSFRCPLSGVLKKVATSRAKGN